MTQQNLKKWSYVVLIAPGLLLYGSLIIFPILSCFTISFTDWIGVGWPKFVGFQNYLKILNDPVFYHGLRNNLLVVAVSVFGQIPIGFTLAYILYRKMVRGEAFFTAMIFLPITISAIVVAILWQQIFSPVGLYTALMRIIKHDPRYVLRIFENKTYAIFPILFVILWMYTGTYLIIFLANLQKVSPSIIEAAIIDGASEGQILVSVILPSMTTVLLTTIIFAITGSLTSFDLIFAMTGGGPAHYTEVIAIYMYTNTFKYRKYGFGSAVSMIIVILSIGLISLLRIIFRKIEAKYE
ncbi:binding-protein-dependent transport systems inner membrane component [Candidatus Vecturithrix granuli]|uniref:Binding-protein-dependent transport systems inner membrane component n=1 Tax=Vecturithrix granuli TaxID=1499967 RepID=A0A081C7I8_VECG1|nr:binding-protein-dependent transport systems inner membrane component [Candidatus Vecturithrix granuli]